MPLQKELLKQGILGVLKQMKQVKDPEGAEEKFADLLADVIDGYVKTGTVNVNVTTVTTTASPTGPLPGTGTGTGTGTIS
jgi:hypothetical protein